MGFKNFRIGLIIRTLFLGMAIFLAIYASNQKEWYTTIVISSIAAIIFLIEIIRYAEKYKRSLSDFLISINSRDFISSMAIADKATKDILKDAYDNILNEFQNIRIEKEIHYHYLTTIVEHIRIALFSFDETGKIEFINKTAYDLFKLSKISHINDLKTIDQNLYKLILHLKTGENELFKTKIHDELMHLSVYSTEFKIQNKIIKLISLQNIKKELEYQELESWQKLIRVLTHEIMNSVTPISSLSSAINETLEESNDSKSNLLKISDEDFQDMISSLKTIENRSKGLLKFVSTYKELTRIPKPDFKEINLVELINHCKTLLKQSFEEFHINFQFNCSCNEINLYADYDQIEQVIINLLINAIEAVKDQINPEIVIKISEDLKISIKDNGKGIDPDEIDKIFIPFYTTKKEGSGIGLSLSRQIIRLHKGTIQVNSVLGKGTEFIIEL